MSQEPQPSPPIEAVSEKTAEPTVLLSAEKLRAARQFLAALQAAIDAVDSGRVALDELKIPVAVIAAIGKALPPPSPSVQAVVNEHIAAVAAVKAETAFKRAVATTLEVAAMVGRIAGIVVPFLALLITMLMAAILLVGIGCTPVEKGAVKADANVQVTAPIFSPGSGNITSQPVSQTAPVSAGRDARSTPIVVDVNAPGSGWPVVAVVALIAAAVCLGLAIWTSAGAQKAGYELRSNRLMMSMEKTAAQAAIHHHASWLRGLAAAIARLPATADRDRLLEDIGKTIPDRLGWDGAVESWGLRVQRIEQAKAVV